MTKLRGYMRPGWAILDGVPPYRTSATADSDTRAATALTPDLQRETLVSRPSKP